MSLTIRFGNAYRVNLTKHPDSRSMQGMTQEEEHSWVSWQIGEKLTYTPGQTKKYCSFYSEGDVLLLDNKKDQPDALTEHEFHQEIRRERKVLLDEANGKPVDTDKFNAPFPKWEKIYKDKALANPDTPVIEVTYKIEPRHEDQGPTPITYFSNELVDMLEQSTQSAH